MLEAKLVELIAKEITVSPEQVTAAIDLFDSGSSIPFVARYRKDATGKLDEKKLEVIAARNKDLTALTQRRKAILETLAKKAILTDELREKIQAATDKAALEDLYLPFRSKRRPKAAAAEERGLGPLADFLLGQQPNSPDIEEHAATFVKPEKSVSAPEEALDGALHILAERFAADAATRAAVRELMSTHGNLTAKSTKNAQGERTKFEPYYDFSEPVAKIPSHRMLAILRGVKAGYLRIDIALDDDRVLEQLLAMHLKPSETEGPSPFEPHIRQAIREAYAHNLRPAIENDVMNLARERAEKEAIRVFRENAENLLLAAAAGPINVIGIGSGPRKACTLAVVDRTGALIESHKITMAAPKAAAQPPATSETPEPASATEEPAPSGDQPAEAQAPATPEPASAAEEPAPSEDPPAEPHVPKNNARAIEELLLGLVQKHQIRAIAIANGGGAREMAKLVKSIVAKRGGRDVCVVMVNETSTSTYATSRMTREEFPDLNIHVRGAIFIARRLQNPIAELVKVDPRSVGVGQYQHDVNQKDLREALCQTVSSCVNRVGVDANRSSVALLRYVNGLQMGTAQHTISYRIQSGGFKSRQQLMEVDGIGPKIFEQCIGFLRIIGGDNPLDATAIHPEAYSIVDKMAQSVGTSVAELIRNRELIEKIDFDAFKTPKIGPFALADIRGELLHPGRDPRKRFRPPKLIEGVNAIDDLKESMEMEGCVTNVTDFGAFVDIGLDQDGLVHLSELSRRFVRDPRDIVKVGQIVRVKIIKVDRDIPRISLSMKAAAPPRRKPPSKQPRKQPPRKPPESSEEPRPERPERPRQDHAGARPPRDADGPTRRRPDDRGPRRDAKGPRDRDKTPAPRTRAAKHAQEVRVPRGARGPRPKTAQAGDSRPFNTPFADGLAELKDKLDS